MPRALFLLLTNLALAALATAQNLVPNPSFEDQVLCPDSLGQIYRAAGWSPWQGTPDYYSACGSPNVAGVPLNYYGEQEAYTGERYAGLICYSTQGDADNSVREYPGTQLTQPLTIGETYYASLRISLTVGNNDVGIYWYAINRMGLLLTTQPFDPLEPGPLPNRAHVYAAQVVQDSMGWVLVEGSFVADSAYSFVTVGNFFPDDVTIGVSLVPNSPPGYAYYFVDDVCVSTTGSCLGSGNGVVETVSMPVLQANATEITCQGCTGAIGLMVCDASGRCVWVPRFENAEKWTVQVPTWLAGGAYVVSLTTEASRQVARFVKPQQ